MVCKFLCKIIHMETRNDNNLTEEEENMCALMMGAVTMYVGYELMQRTERVSRPLRADTETCYEKVQRYLNGHPATIFNKIRMTATAFRMLTNLLKDRQLLKRSYYSCVEEKLMITLEILAQATTNREAQDYWNRSAETVSRWFGEVLYALCMLKDNFIKPPNYDRIPKFIRHNHMKYLPWFVVSL